MSGESKKKFLRATLSLFLILCLFSVAWSQQAPYVASRLREPFHHSWCKWAQKIAAENAVWYQTRAEAIADGHRPCKVCNP